MRTQPIIPYTAADQVNALNRMAPELVTKRHRLGDPDTAASLLTIARNLERVAQEEGVSLRIVEASPSMPVPNPLSMPLANAVAERRTLQWNVSRGLLSAFPLLSLATWLAMTHRDWLTALLVGTMALTCLPLIVMSHQAECREVY